MPGTYISVRRGDYEISKPKAKLDASFIFKLKFEEYRNIDPTSCIFSKWPFIN